MNKKLFFILIILISPAFIPAQSTYLEEGVNGSAFRIDSTLTESGLKTIGFSAGYSIGGIMDFGLMLDTEKVTIDNYESTDISFSFLYNMIIIKQNLLNPLNVQLESLYGFTDTSSDYLDLIDRRGEAQGFDLGVFVYHVAFQQEILKVLLGGKVNYSNYLKIIYDYENANLPEVFSSIRYQQIKYGGTVALLYCPGQWPICTAQLTVFYDPVSGVIEYSPSIGITNSFH